MILTRWERFYLQYARGGLVRVPVGSTVANSLIEKGLIYRVGLKEGRTALYRLTPAGMKVRDADTD